MCGARQYAAVAPTPTTNRICANFTVCNSTTEYQSSAGTPTSNRVCTALTTCAASQFQSRAPTATTDRRCTAFTANESVIIQLGGLDEQSFVFAEGHVVAGLGVTLQAAVHVLNYIQSAPVSRRRAAAAVNITLVAVSAQTSRPEPGTAVAAALRKANATLCGGQSCLRRAVGYPVLYIAAVITHSVPPLPNRNISTIAKPAQGALGAFITLSQLWINLIQPASLPYSDIGNIVAHMRNKSVPSSSSQVQSDAISFAMPFMIMAGFALLMAIAFPIVMLFICCCRTCRCCCCFTKCGGRRLQHEPQPKLHAFLAIALVALSVLAILSASGIIVGDQALTSGKNNLQASIIGVLNHIVQLKNLTVLQASNIVDVQYYTMVDNVNTVFNTISGGQANDIQASLRGDANILIYWLQQFGDLVNRNLADVETMQDTATTLTDDLALLQSQLSSFFSTTSNLQQDCVNTVGTNLMPAHQSEFALICAMYPGTPIAVILSYASFPDLSSYNSSLQGVMVGNFSQQSQLAQVALDRLNVTIQKSINKASSSLNSKMSSFHDSIESQFSTQINNVNSKFNKYVKYAAWQGDVNKYFTTYSYIKDFDTYHPLASFIVAGLFMGVAALALLAAICGFGGSPQERDPRLRTDV